MEKTVCLYVLRIIITVIPGFIRKTEDAFLAILKNGLSSSAVNCPNYPRDFVLLFLHALSRLIPCLEVTSLQCRKQPFAHNLNGPDERSLTLIQFLVL